MHKLLTIFSFFKGPIVLIVFFSTKNLFGLPPSLLISQTNSKLCAQALNDHLLDSSLDPNVLQAFERMQEAYSKDNKMWDWVIQETIPTKIYEKRQRAGVGIEGPIDGGPFGKTKILLVDLISEVPLITNALGQLLQMRWDGYNVFDLPEEFKILDSEKRPFKVRDAPEIYGDFSSVLLKEKIYKARGFVPIQINEKTIYLRFKIIIHKQLSTAETTLESSLSYLVLDSTHIPRITEIYNQALPGRPISEKSMRGNRNVIINVHSGKRKLSEVALIDVLESLKYLSHLINSKSLLPFNSE